jgi:hypothetical protein
MVAGSSRARSDTGNTLECGSFASAHRGRSHPMQPRGHGIFPLIARDLCLRIYGTILRLDSRPMALGSSHADYGTGNARDQGLLPIDHRGMFRQELPPERGIFAPPVQDPGSYISCILPDLDSRPLALGSSHADYGTGNARD